MQVVTICNELSSPKTSDNSPKKENKTSYGEISDKEITKLSNWKDKHLFK
jgi:hypothetical protein